LVSLYNNLILQNSRAKLTHTNNKHPTFGANSFDSFAIPMTNIDLSPEKQSFNFKRQLVSKETDPSLDPVKPLGSNEEPEFI
jgi:hypothetical protein